MIVAQWHIQEISREQLESKGWHFRRYIAAEWIEMGLGKE